MNPKFHHLPEDRQAQILNGAMAVFGRHEYAKAGTEEIAQTCGISKGLLYHYFDSKKQLYLALYEHGLRFTDLRVQACIASKERDFFKILSVSMESMLHSVCKHPPLFDFMTRAYREQDKEVRPEMDALNARLYPSGAPSMFQNLDTSKFRKRLELNRALEITGWISEGFLKRYKSIQSNSIESVLQEFADYMDIFKRAFYKEDYR